MVAKDCTHEIVPGTGRPLFSDGRAFHSLSTLLKSIRGILPQWEELKKFPNILFLFFCLFIPSLGLQRVQHD